VSNHIVLASLMVTDSEGMLRFAAVLLSILQS
jgi:hypothetical protein